MSDDTKNQNSSANSTSSAFNKNEKLNRAIAAASPDTKAEIATLEKLHKHAKAQLVEYQNNTQEDRIAKRFQEKFEAYVNDSSMRMNTPEAQANDIKIMKEEVRKQVVQNDEWSRKNLDRALQSNIYASLDLEKNGAQIQHEVEQEIGD